MNSALVPCQVQPLTSAICVSPLTATAPRAPPSEPQAPALSPGMTLLHPSLAQKPSPQGTWASCLKVVMVTHICPEGCRQKLPPAGPGPAPELRRLPTPISSTLDSLSQDISTGGQHQAPGCQPCALISAVAPATPALRLALSRLSCPDPVPSLRHILLSHLLSTSGICRPGPQGQARPKPLVYPPLTGMPSPLTPATIASHCAQSHTQHNQDPSPCVLHGNHSPSREPITPILRAMLCFTPLGLGDQSAWPPSSAIAHAEQHLHGGLPGPDPHSLPLETPKTHGRATLPGPDFTGGCGAPKLPIASPCLQPQKENQRSTAGRRTG